MAHLYEVGTSHGTFNVSTNHHHDDHSDQDFRRHLLHVIMNTAGSVASGIILHHYTYRGRK